MKAYSCEFQTHLNGGLRIACMTMFALVFAGSSRLPMPDGLLKQNLFAHSIESSTVYVEIAINPYPSMSFLITKASHAITDHPSIQSANINMKSPML